MPEYYDETKKHGNKKPRSIRITDELYHLSLKKIGWQKSYKVEAGKLDEYYNFSDMVEKLLIKEINKGVIK